MHRDNFEACIVIVTKLKYKNPRESELTMTPLPESLSSFLISVVIWFDPILSEHEQFDFPPSFLSHPE